MDDVRDRLCPVDRIPSEELRVRDLVLLADVEFQDELRIVLQAFALEGMFIPSRQTAEAVSTI